METKFGGLTVSFVEPVTEPEVAVIVLAPGAVVLTIPVLLMVAIAEEEAHVTVLVISCVLPSLYVPVAVNCCWLPANMLGF